MNPHLAPLFATMSSEGQLVLKFIGVFGLIVLIPAGILLFKNQNRWFGRSGDTPSETSGSLTYGLAQTWLVYVGLMHLMLWLVFGL
ncbi:hypothetical protein [Prosthecobacter sp.]|uniref:hypothetical protein n=1 Tax=Prosthecobacter sp. TaxID=1965333 RepID=UPI003783C6CF